MERTGRRTAAAAASLAILAGGVAWSGCGSSDDTNSASSAIEQGNQAIQKGLDKAQRKLEKAQKKLENPLTPEQKKKLNQATENAQNAAGDVKQKANEAAKQAQQAIDNSGY